MRLKYIAILSMIVFVTGPFETATAMCPYAFSGAIVVYSYTWGQNNSHGIVTFKILDVGDGKMRVQITDTGKGFGNVTVVNDIAAPDNFPAVSVHTIGNETIQFGAHYLGLENILYLTTPYGERHAYEYTLRSVHFYFDKETGILLKETSSSGQLKSMNLAQTNIIGHKTADLIPYALGAGIIATVIIVAVYLKKKY